MADHSPGADFYREKGGIESTVYYNRRNTGRPFQSDDGAHLAEKPVHELLQKDTKSELLSLGCPDDEQHNKSNSLTNTDREVGSKISASIAYSIAPLRRRRTRWNKRHAVMKLHRRTCCCGWEVLSLLLRSTKRQNRREMNLEVFFVFQNVSVRPPPQHHVLPEAAS